MNTTQLRVILSVADGEYPAVHKGRTESEISNAINVLVRDGFIEDRQTLEPRGLALTDKGRVFVDALAALPPPVQHWTMP